jgi:serine/threonine protein kinase
MGRVLEARDRRLRRTVALKQLLEDARGNPVANQLFLREARAAASLNHPNIVTVYDVDEIDGSIYIAMEFLEGEGLDAILRKRGHLAPKDACRIGAQICSGLGFAHGHGLIHRDIKTSNLFLTNSRIVKIMDFGLAKFTAENRRARGGLGGTPQFMSPEQTTGAPVDHRSDLYSLGITLFHLLTGSVPFSGGDIAEQHRLAVPPDPREIRPEVPEALARLIRALLAKRPEERPAEASWVGQRLTEGASGEPR